MNNLKLRWMVKKDIDSVLKIQSSLEGLCTLKRKNFFSMVADRDSFDFGFSDSDSFITYVCEFENRVAAYIVYQVSILDFNIPIYSDRMYELKSYLPMCGEIKDLCVLDSLRKKGIGRFIINSLIRKFSDVVMFSLKNAVARPFLIHSVVSERNLNAQLFFKKNNFLVRNISYNFFGEDHDGYSFVYENVSFQNLNPIKEKVFI